MDRWQTMFGRVKHLLYVTCTLHVGALKTVWLPDYAHGRHGIFSPNFLWACVPFGPMNACAKFELRSFIRFWDNRGIPPKLDSPGGRLFVSLSNHHSHSPSRITFSAAAAACVIILHRVPSWYHQPPCSRLYAQVVASISWPDDDVRASSDYMFENVVK